MPDCTLSLPRKTLVILKFYEVGKIHEYVPTFRNNPNWSWSFPEHLKVWLKRWKRYFGETVFRIYFIWQEGKRLIYVSKKTQTNKLNGLCVYVLCMWKWWWGLIGWKLISLTSKLEFKPALDNPPNGHLIFFHKPKNPVSISGLVYFLFNCRKCSWKVINCPVLANLGQMSHNNQQSNKWSPAITRQKIFRLWRKITI